MATFHPSQPDEAQILTSYLLHPSPLSTILSYTQFQALVPKAATAHPTELKRLYRDLQFQRDITVDDVRRRIETECRRSISLQARLARNLRRETGTKRKRAKEDDEHREDPAPSHEIAEEADSDSDPDRSVKIDTAMNGALGNTLQPQTKNHNHTSKSLLSSLATAAEDLESEVASLEAKLTELKHECEERVGGLSDLRYGKFAAKTGLGDTVEEQTVEQLKALKKGLEHNGHE